MSRRTEAEGTGQRDCQDKRLKTYRSIAVEQLTIIYCLNQRKRRHEAAVCQTKTTETALIHIDGHLEQANRGQK